MHTLFDEETTTESQEAPLYHTVVHNCNCHTFQDVTFGLMRIVGTGMRDAELKAKEIDFFGKGNVATTSKEEAEALAARLHNEVVSSSGTLLQTSVEKAR
jgi:hypothetical protein